VTWTLEFTKKSRKALNKLDKTQALRITEFLEAKLAKQQTPRDLGQALVGELAGYWRYRVGDYRIICDIQDETIIILVIEIGHRSMVYR
jgi:mRNA interferase RelE/StbE